MQNRFLILSSWVYSTSPLVNLAEAVVTLLIDQTDWRHQDDKDQPYSFDSTWPPGGKSRGVGSKTEGFEFQVSREEALRHIKQRNVGGIRLSFPGNWRDPYVLDKRIYCRYLVNIEIEQTSNDPNFFFVMIGLQYSSLWFCPTQFAGNQFAEVLYSNYGIVRDSENAGYKLNKGALLHGKQSYVAKEEISQENRRKVITGLAKYIRHFSPEGAILTYYGAAKYNRRQKVISYSKNIYYPPSMYYLGQGVTISPKSLEYFNASYFVKEIEGVNLYLEEEHFGFLK